MKVLISTDPYIWFLFHSVCGTGGRWACEVNEACLGRCVISGEQNYQTFDNRKYSFEGQCEYVLVSLSL